MTEPMIEQPEQPQAPRASVTTTKAVLLHELSEQLGGVHVEASGLSFVDGEEATITADVDQADLEAAIDAHTPSQTIPHPNPPGE